MDTKSENTNTPEQQQFSDDLMPIRKDLAARMYAGIWLKQHPLYGTMAIDKLVAIPGVLLATVKYIVVVMLLAAGIQLAIEQNSTLIGMATYMCAAAWYQMYAFGCKPIMAYIAKKRLIKWGANHFDDYLEFESCLKVIGQNGIEIIMLIDFLEATGGFDSESGKEFRDGAIDLRKNLLGMRYEEAPAEEADDEVQEDSIQG